MSNQKVLATIKEGDMVKMNDTLYIITHETRELFGGYQREVIVLKQITNPDNKIDFFHLRKAIV